MSEKERSDGKTILDIFIVMRNKTTIETETLEFRTLIQGTWTLAMPRAYNIDGASVSNLFCSSLLLTHTLPPRKRRRNTPLFTFHSCPSFPFRLLLQEVWVRGFKAEVV
ncbi:hypothetical protein RJT34_24431 [Clitoria ternatea]|uniref:Uncharacterized protein n=1 Tax=Clitoria ternatea TaxID=43366 RepID=A0AAN9FN84_CLITE